MKTRNLPRVRLSILLGRTKLRVVSGHTYGAIREYPIAPTWAGAVGTDILFISREFL
jgi:hypothetical protein